MATDALVEGNVLAVHSIFDICAIVLTSLNCLTLVNGQPIEGRSYRLKHFLPVLPPDGIQATESMSPIRISEVSALA